MAKRASTKATKKRPSAKRELIAPRGDKRYIRRDQRGRIKESDDVSRSQSQDRRRKAKQAAGLQFYRNTDGPFDDAYIEVAKALEGVKGDAFIDGELVAFL